jgi:hypothetical protein
MILTIVLSGYFLGVLLQNIIWGYLVGLTFWVMGWLVTRQPKRISSFSNTAEKPRMNQLPAKTLTNIQLFLFNNNVVFSANGKWISATALFQIKEPLSTAELRIIQHQLQQEQIPLFTYSILDPDLSEERRERISWGIQMFLGIRISQKSTRGLDEQQLMMLSSKVKMGASRIVKAIQQNLHNARIRRLEDIELLRAMKGIMFAPNTEKIAMENSESLWIRLEEQRY